MTPKSITVAVLFALTTAACDQVEDPDVYDDRSCDLDDEEARPLVISGYERGIAVFYSDGRPVVGFEVEPGFIRCWDSERGFNDRIETGTMIVIESREGYALAWGSVAGLGCFAPDAFDHEEIVLEWREGGTFKPTQKLKIAA